MSDDAQIDAAPEPANSEDPPSVSPESAEETELFLAFVRHRDVYCPRCGHNLRAATKMRCPECGDDLNLAIAGPPAVLRWFLAAIAPGIFSGITTCLLTLAMLTEPGAPAWVYVLLAFGITSGIVALCICLIRQRFLRLAFPTQQGVAAVIWITHIGMFFIFIWPSY